VHGPLSEAGELDYSTLEEALESGGLFREIIEQIADGVYILDRERRIVYWNSGAENIAGFSAGEVLGRRCSDNILIHVDERAQPLCLSGCVACLAMETGEVREADAYLHHKAGHRVPIHSRVSPLTSSSGEVVGGIEVFHDNRDQVAARRKIEELERLSLLDQLTGIGNRRFGEAHVTSKLAELETYGWPFGVLFFDIDHFKNVNDTFGHAAGDDVLKMVALTARNAIRAADVVSRWGGEEFAAVIEQVETDTLLEIGDKTRALVQESNIDRDGEQISVTVSVGATMARPGDDPETLMSRADVLMYASKDAGRNKVTLG